MITKVVHDAIQYFLERSKIARNFDPGSSLSAVEAATWKNAANHLEQAWCAIRQPVTATDTYRPAAVQQICTSCRMLKVLQRSPKDMMTTAERVLLNEMERLLDEVIGLKKDNGMLSADLKHARTVSSKVGQLRGIQQRIAQLPRLTINFGGQEHEPATINRDKVLAIIDTAIMENEQYG